ncbi:MAG: amidohydrolase family protein [Thermovirga sp.]|nr:amidohydrolase family protein [Thermovirga sp.]
MESKKWDIVIKEGEVVFPDARKIEKKDIFIKDGKIKAISGVGAFSTDEAEKTIDARGLMVSPGFIDIHMHNEEREDPYTVEKSLLLQGVTTALAGNCGSGLLMDEFLSIIKKPYMNMAFLTGHRRLREAAGVSNAYQEATPKEISKMCDILEKELEKGSLGLSLGLEYAPNTSWEEIWSLTKVVSQFNKRLVSSHIRFDGPRCIEAVEEMITLAEKSKVRMQISHLGSMTAFGKSAEALEMIKKARDRGVDIGFDTYPYGAFCTFMGSTVFDPGFEERWNKGLEALEVASGPHKGKRLNDELYKELRENAPSTLIVAHVMNEDEMKLCLRHPMAALGSDAVLERKSGHPRAAGAFPRGLRWLREEDLSWPEAIYHLTTIPAERMWMDSTIGAIKEGFSADFVLFDPDKLEDKATFNDPLLPPEGIEYVVIGGNVAVEKGKLLDEPQGNFILRK